MDRRAGITVAVVVTLAAWFLAPLTAAAAPDSAGTTGGATKAALEAGWSPNGGSTAAASPAAQAAMTRAVQQGPKTVPLWSGSFTSDAVNYPYFMVGGGPAVSETVRVPTVLIPINLTFQTALGGANPTVYGTSRIGAVLNSPIFQRTSFPQTGDVTEYSDAVVRAEWSGEIQDLKTFHTLVDLPTVLAPVRLTVPSSVGEVVNPGDGIPRAEVNGQWWSQVIPGLVSSLHISPTVLPIFVTSDLGAGLAAGFHGAFEGQTASGQTAIWTYAWASWFDPGWFSTFGFDAQVGDDALVLGHEVTEWMNDPFLINVVPSWTFSDPPIIVNACSNLLETGDPLELTHFTVTSHGMTFHLQDAAFFSYFARQDPSIGYHGQYSLLGTLTTFSTPCTSP